MLVTFTCEDLCESIQHFRTDAKTHKVSEFFSKASKISEFTHTKKHLKFQVKLTTSTFI